MSDHTVEVTFKIVGPMKRSTLGRESVEPVERATNDILHWSWSTRLQVERLRASLASEFETWNAKPRVRSRRGFSRTSYDEHLVFVAAANLSRALDCAPRPLRKAATLGLTAARALRLLRDVYEHWDQLRAQVAGHRAADSGAAARLGREFPGAEPWSLTFDIQTGDIVLANLVDVKQFVADLRRLEAAVLRSERKRERAKRPSNIGFQPTAAAERVGRSG